MSLTLIVLAGFYAPAHHAIQYADTLAQAVRGHVVLLHANRASLFDPYVLADAVGKSYHRDELNQQVDTAAALYRQAEKMTVPTTVEVVTDLLPEIARDLATRFHPALFVIGQPDKAHPDRTGVAAACGELLRAGHYPVLTVPVAAPVVVPHRLLIAADREPFALAPSAQPLRQLFNLFATSLVVAHVSEDVEDDAGCGAALRAVQTSGLAGLLTPELRGYVAGDYADGVLTAAADTQADLVMVLARQRSYLGELFHRSVTARLLNRSPKPVLVLPTATEKPRAAQMAHAHAALAE